MGLQRSGSVKVADVRVPQRLLSTRVRRGDWEPHHQGRQVLDQRGPVQDAIRGRQRSSSTTSTIGERSTEPGIGRPRKTSDPITPKEAAFVRSSSLLSLDDMLKKEQEKSARPRNTLDFGNFRPQNLFRASWASTDGPSREKSQGPPPQRSGTVKSIVNTARNAAKRVRRGSMAEVYEKAKLRGVELERKRWVQITFEYSFYLILLSFIYFVLVGLPLWKGAVWWLYWVVSTKFVIAGGWSIVFGVAAFYAFGPLFILFEKEPPAVDEERPHNFDRSDIPGVRSTALLIPCYKSETIIGPTLEAALKIFPPSHIFVIANGNSETPLDNTEEVCRPFGVNHIWSPVGSKIVAQFVGCYAAKGFENVLLIDDDCALPSNFPVVSERLGGKVMSIGYTIKSVGPNSSKGTWCQQAQDLEYKCSGLQRALAGKMGSVTFPHGAISLWNRNFLIQTFHDHPGFSVSEDWFFGHSCRRLGGRIKMCTSVFVETETPDAVFFSSGGSRGGFGEMTVFKQRFLRWNFFFVNGMWYNLAYILGSWKLGFWEIGAKIFVFQEVYETLLYLFTPFVLPISFIVKPSFCGYLLLGTIAMYLVNVVIFNELHLRLRKERVSWTVILFYYMPYKLILTLINVSSCYWSLFKYAQYFAKRHPKVIEDANAVEVVMRLEEKVNPTQNPFGDDNENPFDDNANPFGDDNENPFDDHANPFDDNNAGRRSDEAGRRMFVTAVASRPSVRTQRRPAMPAIPGSVAVTPNRLSFDYGADECISPDPTRPDPVFQARDRTHHAHFAPSDPEKNGHVAPGPSLLHSFSKRTGRRRTSWSESWA
ncbi:nucleotide-diphospho-sugar transferase [Xylariaceae sp. FL0804]|nr:nucleotide-diphospho-sugar transferase [Xylariaceae sp. FL0804]